jgi:hypothetical protein
MDLEALALAVDDRVRVPAAHRVAARLYAVRVFDTDHLPISLQLEVLAEGEARELPQQVRPPAGVTAIALAATAWLAPVEEDGGAAIRPSLHPERRRAHVTVLVSGDDGDEVSVLRLGQGQPQVLRDGVGVVTERMVHCWARRGEPDGRGG